jgi:phosphoadenosine phosphosulfate reductase
MRFVNAALQFDPARRPSVNRPDFDDAADRRGGPLAAEAERLAGLDGRDLLRALLGGRLAGRVAMVSSFGAESAVLLDMISQIDPATPVIFLDTRKLFPETLAYRDALRDRLRLTDVRTVRPDPRDLDRLDPDGALWSRDPDLCCHIRKTEPLDRALRGFDAWITGRKRFHGDGRKNLPTVEFESPTGRLKINPVVSWTLADIRRHMAERDLPAHPLLGEGYASIGCVPCTRPVGPGEDVRGGRWSWLEKSECGIHGMGSAVD